MPQKKEPVKRWPSQTFAQGYIQNRNGFAVLRYGQHSKATGLRFGDGVYQGEVTIKAECLRRLDEWLPAVMSGASAAEQAPQQRAPVTTVAALVVDFQAAHWQAFTDSVRHHYRAAIREFFPASLPVVPLDLQAIAQRIEEVSSTTKLAPATLANRRKYLKAFFRHAVRRGYLTANPVDVARSLPRRIRKGALVYTKQQVDMICWWFYNRDIGTMVREGGAWVETREERRGQNEHFLAGRYALLWRFLYYTGCRISEALALRWSDFDGHYLTIQGKRDVADAPKPRVFPVDAFPEVRELLDELCRYPVRGGYIFPWRSSTAPTEYLRRCLVALGIVEPPDPRKAGKVQIRKIIGYSAKTFRATAKDRWERELGLSDKVSNALCGHTQAVANLHYRPDVDGARLAEAIARELAP